VLAQDTQLLERIGTAMLHLFALLKTRN